MNRRDVLQVGKLLALTLIAWFVPPRYWRKVVNVTNRISQNDQSLSIYRYFLRDKYSDSEILGFSAKHQAYSRELKLAILGMDGP